MRQDQLPTEKLVERYRRSRQQAMIVAVAACFLAGGVILGVLLSRGAQISPKVVIAGDREVNAELSSAFVMISRQVEPSVVNISTVSQPSTRQRLQNEFSLPRPQLDSPQYGNNEPARRGNGSGVIVDPQGYILTNHHVILGADRIKVRLFDGNELPARAIGSDPETDLAVVKVDSQTPLSAARLGDSERMRVGDWVLAIGSPFGLDQTVTAGIISAKERDSTDLYKKVGFQYFLQTDAAINRGNSGGPLINLSGEVIGINTAIATSTGDYNGICFALPTSEAILVYKQLVDNGRVVRGFFGALPERVTPQIAKVYGLSQARGAIISNISDTVRVGSNLVESPAAKAGLKLNDIIIEYRGNGVKDDSELIRRVASTPVGTSVPVKIVRDGKEMMLSVVIGRRPGSSGSIITPTSSSISSDQSPRSQNIGIRFETLTPKKALDKDINSRGILVVGVEPGSIAEDAELKQDDIIEMINREPVRNNEDFKRVLNRLRSGDPIVLQVYRSGAAPYPRIFISFNKP
jgi:serine protease Do